MSITVDKEQLPPVTVADMLSHYDFKKRQWHDKLIELRKDTLYVVVFASALFECVVPVTSATVELAGQCCWLEHVFLFGP
jgi:hypothetical protein